MSLLEDWEVIERVEGVNTRGRPLWQIRVALAERFAAAEPVHLTVVDRLVDERREVELAATAWEPQVVTQELRDGVVVVRVQSLPRGAAASVREAVPEDRPMLLDLRDLVWGDEEEAVRVADLFAASGTLGIWRGRKVGEKAFPADPGVVRSTPPVVLVGPGPKGPARSWRAPSSGSEARSSASPPRATRPTCSWSRTATSPCGCRLPTGCEGTTPPSTARGWNRASWWRETPRTRTPTRCSTAASSWRGHRWRRPPDRSVMTRRRAGRGGWLLALLVIVLAGVVLVLLLLGRGRGTPAGPTGADFGDRLRTLAARRGAGPKGVVADDPINKVSGVFVRSWRVTVPDDEAARGLVADIQAEAASWQGRGRSGEVRPPAVARLRVDLDHESFDIEVRLRARPTPTSAPTAPPSTPTPPPRPSPRPGSRGRLAILLDDGGYTLDLLPAVVALPRPVAVSVLPFLPHSAEVAAALHRGGHEVWLHLPMEAGSGEEPGPGAVMVGMSPDEIRTIVHSALNSVPHAVGVNNHMGSRATSDLRTMTWVMQELSARGMLPSSTPGPPPTPWPRRRRAARASRPAVATCSSTTIGTGRRSGCQLAEAVYRSRTEGPIIAIGHLTQVTVEVLEEELPTLDARGVALVPPTKLMK